MTSIPIEKYSPEEQSLIEKLDVGRLPRHIAIIMDGNGRWATGQGFPRVIGHRAGVESIRSTIETCIDLGIGYLTLYSFSTENWSRPEDEVKALMGLIEQQLITEAEGLNARGVRILHLGRTEGLPDSLINTLHDVQELTKENTKLTVQFAINYSGRAELLDAAKRIAAAAAAGEIDPTTLTEEDFSTALYHPNTPDPDLLIRTAGDQRVSNYLLWQIAYCELYVIADFWPEFRSQQLLNALLEYQYRQRKFGRVVP